MSTFLPNNFTIQDAALKDFERIYRFSKGHKQKMFGASKRDDDDPYYFFYDTICHRMMIFDNNSAIIGYAEFANYPPIEALNNQCWMDWFNHHYCTHLPLTPARTLFFSYFIYSPTHMPQVLYDVLSECFIREPMVQYILAVQMPDQQYKSIDDIPQFHILNAYSKVYYPREFNVKTCKNVQKIHIIERTTILKHARCRMALPEDNDDIMEIIDMNNPEIRGIFGDYLIAEELLSEEGHRSTIIVTEINNSTSGFLWFNRSVDFHKLYKNYDLDPFANLLKVTSNKRFSHKVMNVTKLVRKPSVNLYKVEKIMKVVNNKCCSFENLSTCSLVSKLPVTSICGHISDISSETERFYLRENFFNMCHEFEKLLRNKEYYTIQVERPLHIWFNIEHDETFEDIDFDEKSNAFALQLMGLHKSLDVRRIFRFLAIAFSAFPDRDYCLLSISHRTKITKSIFEILKYFIPVESRYGCTTNDILYVTHRSTIYGNITLNKLQPDEISEIDKMLNYSLRNSLIPIDTVSSDSSAEKNDFSNILKSEAKFIHEIMDEVMENPLSEYDFFTIRCGRGIDKLTETTLVGFVILREFHHVENLKFHFHLTSPVSLNVKHAEIISLRLHPNFRIHSDIIFREIARLTSYSKFFYIAPIRIKKVLTNDLITTMQPIEPKRIKKIYKNIAANEENFYSEGSFAVFQNNLRPTRYFGNRSKIVIIGFSELCRAFLRVLSWSFNIGTIDYSYINCCAPKLNVTVIAPSGVVEAEHDHNFHCNKCTNKWNCWVNFQNSNAYIRDTVKRMDLRTWVKFVTGNVTQIDRNNHVVVIDNDCDVYYDTLLLFCDNSYGPPKELVPKESLPSNYVHINSRLDKIILYFKLKALMKHTNEKHINILIYGSHLSTFEFINFLLTHDIDGSYITLVRPYVLKEAIRDFNLNNPYHDTNIETILLEMIEDLGVTIYERFLFVDWKLYPETNLISAILFQNSYDDEQINIKCDLFVCFHENNMDYQFAYVLQEAGIFLTNNKINIDENYRTNDDAIMAFGKHVEQFPEPTHQYKYVNPMEVAQKIIAILNLNHSNLNAKECTRRFIKPSFYQARLPMDYYICKIILPKRFLSHHVLSSPSMTTYYDGDFCRVILNEHGIVEQILCITKKDINFDFLQFFVGKHELLLNNLRANCYLNEIDSFLKFFQQPWTELVMHDKLNELLNNIRNLVFNTAEEFSYMTMERTTRKELLVRQLADQGISKEVEKVFIDFLREHRFDFKHPFALPEDFVL